MMDRFQRARAREKVRQAADQLMVLADSRVDVTTMTGDALCSALHAISDALNELTDVCAEQDT